MTEKDRIENGQWTSDTVPDENVGEEEVVDLLEGHSDSSGIEYEEDEINSSSDQYDQQPCVSRRPAEEHLDLPDTVTALVTDDGSRVYLVGTAHFSAESQNDVSRTIQMTQPNVIMVELCKGRMNILKLDEETIIRESKEISLEKIRAVIKQNGFVHGIMYLFLLKMSAHVTEQLGMAPGGEFRRAFSEAKKVPGCMIHLGDRPIQITLHRALSQLSWWQKLCLAWNVITVTKEPITKEEVEKCKNKDLIEELLAEMTGKYPVFSRVFVQERDIYLAHSLRLAAAPIPCQHSETGISPAVVVGVVGMGHIPGIVAQWKCLDEVDIPELLRIPPASLSSRLFKYSLKASACILVAWGVYKVLARPSVLNLLSRDSIGK